MVQRDHKMFTTPVSVNDGLKRADGRTWAILGLAAAIAVVAVVLIQLFVEKPNVKWPSSPSPAAQPAEPAQDEPRTYDVAPPSRVPPPG